MKTFSAIWTAKLGEAIRAASIEPYPIEAHQNSNDWQAIVKAINQGIDSHLEAIHFKASNNGYGRRGLMIEPQTVHVLVRRLLEADDENSQSLASNICQTLDIELI